MYNSNIQVLQYRCNIFHRIKRESSLFRKGEKNANPMRVQEITGDGRARALSRSSSYVYELRVNNFNPSTNLR